MSKYKRAFLAKMRAEGWEPDGDYMLLPRKLAEMLGFVSPQPRPEPSEKSSQAPTNS